MDYERTANQILTALGGSENLISAAHCATRLRLVVADNAKSDAKRLEEIDGVKGVFEAAGQLQIIIGTGTVNKVYDAFVRAAGITEASKDEVKQAASAKQSAWKRAIKTLGDIFVPIIPAIVASGLLMGLLEGFAKLFPAMTQSGTYTIIHLFSNAAFVFLPILVAMSAAKTFGGNQYLGAVIGMIMIHPDLMNAWNVATAESVPTATAWFGLFDINLVGYQGHVIPVVIAVWFMSLIEKRLHRIVPEIIDLFVTPLVTVLVTGYLTLTVFGPVFSALENAVLDGVQWLIALPLGIGAFFAGGLYAPTVVAGVHHMYNALEAGMLSADGVNTWMPIATAANVAQGAAALAFAVKTKSKKQKAMAFPASLSAFLGITEPAIFGVNLKYWKPFVAGCIGGACGALFASVTHIAATAYGITGVFGFLITTDHIASYAILMLISASVSFLLCLFLYRDPKEETVSAPISQTQVANYTYLSPLTGEVIALSDVADPTFAEKVLGDGIAIRPTKGEVVAPCDCTVSSLFDTHHAIALTAKDGTDLLIHIGINTIELKGEGFTPHVADGDELHAGDPLISFDLAGIRAKGYDLITPVIVANTEEYEAVESLAKGAVQFPDSLLRVSPKSKA